MRIYKVDITTLTEAGKRISMDGCGLCIDTISIERH
ncbi:hypothetical protein IWQ51_004134 [Labrenzia sp. EL_142]|nr:hypothetical protein [Labrenzia sp. EL_142]